MSGAGVGQDPHDQLVGGQHVPRYRLRQVKVADDRQLVLFRPKRRVRRFLWLTNYCWQVSKRCNADFVAHRCLALQNSCCGDDDCPVRMVTKCNGVEAFLTTPKPACLLRDQKLENDPMLVGDQDQREALGGRRDLPRVMKSTPTTNTLVLW